MPIVRCKDQKRQTLEEFYSEWASYEDKFSIDLGKAILSIIEFINNTFIETKIFGLTSHAHLILLAQNSSESEWFVKLITNGLEFYIEYLIPKENQPWENAIVKGETTSMEEFKNYIIIAMVESQGWNDSDELQKLYLQSKVEKSLITKKT